MSFKKEQYKRVKKDDYWGWFLAGWPGLSLSVLAVLWSLATSPKYKFIDGFESPLLNVIPAMIALLFLTIGIVGQHTIIGRFVTYFIWGFIIFNVIQDPSILFV